MGSREEGDLEGRRDQSMLTELPIEYLQTLDIPELYRMIHAHLDQRGLVARIKENIAFKRALIAGWVDAVLKTYLSTGETHQEMNRVLMRSESGFIRDLQSLGVHVGVESELSPKRLADKPHLLMSTHQGGGLETYVLAELLRRGGVRNYRYVIKDELVNLPIVGKTISSRKPILVHRSELKDEKKRQDEIVRIGEEIVKALAEGESVLFFFEGTRSKSGEIAHSEKRKEWCRQLNGAIDSAAAKHPDLDYGKALVVLDMLSVLPVAIEKEFTSQVRAHGDCTAKILDADGLSLDENPEDPYDKKTLFGRARSSLKEMLISRVQRYQQEVK